MKALVAFLSTLTAILTFAQSPTASPSPTPSATAAPGSSVIPSPTPTATATKGKKGHRRTEETTAEPSAKPTRVEEQE
jgi:hypothetical protein